MNSRNKLKVIEEANQRLEQLYLKSKGLLKESNETEDNLEWLYDVLKSDFPVKIHILLNKPTSESYGDDFEYGDFEEFYETVTIPSSQYIKLTGDSHFKNKEIIFDQYDEICSNIIKYLSTNERYVYDNLKDFINPASNGTDVEGVITVDNSLGGKTSYMSSIKIDDIDDNKPSYIDWNDRITYLNNGTPVISPKRNNITEKNFYKDLGPFDFTELFDVNFQYVFPNNPNPQRLILIKNNKYLYTNDYETYPRTSEYTFEELSDMYTKNQIGPQTLWYTKN